MENKDLLNTREVAEFLDINEKMVYTLISENGPSRDQDHRKVALSKAPR